MNSIFIIHLVDLVFVLFVVFLFIFPLLLFLSVNHLYNLPNSLQVHHQEDNGLF